MRIKQSVIDQLNTRDVRFAIASTLDVSEVSIRRYLNDNDDNGPLTTAGALRTIREKTGLTDAEILTEANEENASEFNLKKAVT
jgi:DeoR/GlpR family transcriptional regulator of sugar metabolism